MNKNGFTLVETMISLLVISISITFFTTILQIILDKRYKSYQSEDETSLHQIRLLYVLSKNVVIEGDMLSFSYIDNDMHFIFTNHHLVLEPGYQVFYRNLEDVFFTKKGDCFYLVYDRKQDKKERVIGC